MKLIRLVLTCIPLVLFTLNFVYGQQAIPFDDKRWTIQSRGHVLDAYQGYQSIYLQGGEAELKGEKFLNGIIEFDVWLTPRTSFSGFFFRRSSPGNFEDIYFRPHQSGNPDAFQYTPVFNNDPAWQLYHDQFDAVNDGFVSWKPRGVTMGYNGVIKYAFDKWMHVKLVVNGSQAELYLNHHEKPVAFIRQLGMPQQAGSVGIESALGACWFANFSVTHLPNPELKTVSTPIASAITPATISNWQVSAAFREDVVKNTTQLDDKLLARLNWKNYTVENDGVVNLARVSRVTDSTNTVFARFIIHSDKEQIKRLDIGYSDRIRAYCNGQILYSGSANFRTRDYRYLGTIGYFDAVYLPLKKGENVVVMAVSETFGGWGVMGRFESLEGVRVGR